MSVAAQNLKELKAVGDLGMTEQQIKDRIRAIRDIRARQYGPRGGSQR